MTWWVPFPFDFLADPRVKVLSLAARGVLASLIVQARGGDRVPYVNHHDAVGTVAVIALREGAPADAQAAVGAEVDALRRADLLSWDDTARELRLHLTAAAPPRARPAEPTTSPRATRTKPSDDPARSTLRTHQFYFRKRLRQWRDVPEGVTWEAWFATPEGQAWSAKPETAEGCNAPATPATRNGNAALQEGCNAPCNAPATPPPPHTPSPKKIREIERNTQTGNAPATPQGATRNGNAQRPVAGGVAGVSCSSVENLGLDPEAALQAIRTRAGKDRLNLAYDARSLVAWAEVVREIRARPDAPALGAFEALGDWVAAGGLGWWSQGRPSLSYLLRPGKLAELLDNAAAWVSSGRPRITHGTAAPTARPQGASRRVGPAPASTAADFAAEATASDPLADLLRKPTGT